MKISMSLRLRALLFLVACMTVAQARAADAYHEFVADIYLLQSQQTRNPDTVIAYGDGKSGALLKSVLAPEKFGPQLEHYFKLSTRGQDKTLPNLLHAIKPVIDRVFPFARAADAFRHLESGAHFGKVVVAV